MAVSFTDVKEVLDGVMAAWETKHNRTPDLPGVHADPNFGWGNRDQLLRSEGFGFRLIDPALIGNGQGHQTNLVLALTTGVMGLPQMPLDGPYLPQEQIDLIVRWIDDGCPDQAECEARQVAHEVAETAEMAMRDPEVNRQADLAPYPDGPGKLLHKWEVTVGFDTAPGSPIRIKVKGVSGGTAGIRPGNVFDAIRENDVFQDTGFVYDGGDGRGCVVLHRASIPEAGSPPYDPKADHFPNPNQTYPFRRIDANGRWFVVRWSISAANGTPVLNLTADQQPRVATVGDRRCP